MGSRANLVLVEKGTTQVFYNHWCAQRLDNELFFGPAHARDFIASQEPVGEDGWLDDVWAEGGVAMDVDRREVVWFGGEDVYYDIPMRRMLLRWMTYQWQGWSVRWAHEGIAEMADRAGVPRERVDSKKVPEELRVTVLEDAKHRYMGCIGSVRDSAGMVGLFPLGWLWSIDYLKIGPTLIGYLPNRAGFSRLNAHRGVSDPLLPSAGFHVDVIAKTVEFWQARPCADAVARLASLWPGWRIGWEQDRFESQATACGGALTFAVSPPDRIALSLRQILLYEPKPSSHQQVTETLINSGYEITEVNPMMAHDVLVPLDRRKREAIVDAAIARDAAGQARR